ncbi:MAG: hypothetical protein KKA81_15780 [Bacteroidetes bacterium]|nr:hypothetical protein [Bacteroidota bacterium]
MKRFWWFLFGLMILYMLGIIILSLINFDGWVMPLYEDIYGPSHLFALNTTLTMFLLWASALLFIVNAMSESMLENRKRKIIFYLSQALIFFYLGFDDRFRIHEGIGDVFAFDDAFVIIFLGLVEVLILVFYERILKQPLVKWRYLLIAGIFFAIMAVADLKSLPLEKYGINDTLVEDIPKTWAAFFLMIYPLDILLSRIKELREKSERSY